MSEINKLRDAMRQQEPSELARVVLTREIHGSKLSLQVSPCCWMHRNYGLQVQVVLDGGGSVYLHDKELLFENATLADLERMFDKVKLIPCKTCGKPAFDPGSVDTNRGGECEQCFMAALNADLEKAQKKEQRRMERLDAKRKQEGYTHRVDAWIHAGGDDKQIAYYVKGKPTKKQIHDLLRKEKSRELNDYTVITL